MSVTLDQNNDALVIDKTKRYGFMPGCSLPSYNPELVKKTVEYLNQVFPKFSAIQKCCGKPTKAVGQVDLFKERFATLQQDMDEVGIETMIVACQNCKMTLTTAGTTPTISLWELLPIIGLPEAVRGKAKDSDVLFTIHDSCPTRYDSPIQDGIRWILDELGYKYVESEYSRENTRCCGMGGMVMPANPDVAKRVIQKRVDTLPTDKVVVYCAGCRSAMLKGDVDAWHILDLVYGPVVYADTTSTEDVLASPGRAWLNRFRSKNGMNDIMKCPC